MNTTPRLNGIIAAFERGQVPIAAFVSPPTIENGIALSSAEYDGVILESEHNPYDIRGLQDCMQYMLNRRQIAQRGGLSPPVTPLIRIPANGCENSQWLAKQVLDIGAYGVVWPRVSTATQAYNAVAACRYPRPASAPRFEPEGQRGDSPAAAARYWGLTTQEYYTKADVWPLNPEGEILVALMCEDVHAIDNLREILRVPGVGLIIIGEGDLSQNLGYPRQYDHPVVVEAMVTIRRLCAEHGIPCGHPHITERNCAQAVADGYRFLMTGAPRSFAGLQVARRATGRE